MMQKFQDNYDVQVCHAWGMTEMSPLGTLGTLKPEYAELTGEARLDVQMKQGHPPFGVEMKITDDSDRELPRDGKTFGRLKVRGPSVARAYFKEEAERARPRRLFRYRRRRHDRPLRLHADHRPLQGRDQVGRRVDFVDRPGKSRGRASEGGGGRGDRRAPSEMGRAAACWSSCSRTGQSATKDEMLGFFDGKIAKWWMPDDVAFVDEIPHTATGKILKTALREQFKNYVFPAASS